MKNFTGIQVALASKMESCVKSTLLTIIVVLLSLTGRAQYHCYGSLATDSLIYHRDTTKGNFTANDLIFDSHYDVIGSFSSTAVYNWAFSDGTTAVGRSVRYNFTRDNHITPSLVYTLTVVDTASMITATYNDSAFYPYVFNCAYFDTTGRVELTQDFMYACGPTYAQFFLGFRPIGYLPGYWYTPSPFLYRSTANWGTGDSSVVYAGTEWDMDILTYTYPYTGIYKIRTNSVILNPTDSATCPMYCSPLQAIRVSGSVTAPTVTGTTTLCEGDTLRLVAHDTTSFFHNLRDSTDMSGTDGTVLNVCGYDPQVFSWTSWVYRDGDPFDYVIGARNDSVLIIPNVGMADTGLHTFFRDATGYFASSGCPTYVETNVHVTVLHSTLPPISGTRYLCSGNTYTFTDSATGGTWVSNNPTVATVNATTGVVTAVTRGDAIIKYFSGSGCPAIYYTTVDPLTTPGIHGYCSVAPGGIMSLTDSGAGSTWTSSNSSVAAVDGAGNVTGVSPGDALITATLATGCHTFSYTKNVYVSNSPISTVAGDNTYPPRHVGFSGDGGPAVNAKFNSPSTVTVDSRGRLVICDLNNHRLRRIDSLGIITTIAGTGSTVIAGDGGPATAAAINCLSHAIDRHGNLFICDNINNQIRKIDTSGIITLFAGVATTIGGHSGDGGPATAATFFRPWAVVVDRYDNVYISDAGNHVIRKVSPSGVISNFAGNDSTRYSGDGGPATDAGIPFPKSMAVDTSGDLFFVDGFYNVRKIDASGIITTIAGNSAGSYTDGDSTLSTMLLDPSGLACDPTGHLYIASFYYNVFRVSNTGRLNAVAGKFENRWGSASPTFGNTGDGGPAINSLAGYPNGIAIDNSGNIYFTDQYYGTTRKIGTYTTGYTGTVTDTNISQVRITELKDSILAPCTFPSSVLVTIKGGVLGHPSAADSVFLRLYYGDGTISASTVSIDTTTTISIGGVSYFPFSYSVYHSYSGAGTYSTGALAVTNSGTHSTAECTEYHPVFPIINIESCTGAGSVVTTMHAHDTSADACHVPYTARFDITGTLHGWADTTSHIRYLVNFGDGSTDTLVLATTSDSYGIFSVRDTLTHTYTVPGTSTTSIRNLDSAIARVAPIIRIGTSCSRFSGVLYRDVNGNCTADAGEPHLAYWPIAVVNTTLHDTTFVWCDSLGRYATNLLDSNSYLIFANYFGYFGYSRDSLGLSCPSAAPLALFVLPGHTYSQNFGFSCYGSVSTIDMNVSGWGSRFMPGRTTSINVWSSNSYGYMCDTVNATATLTIDSRLTYRGMKRGPAPSSISGHTLTWNFHTFMALLDLQAEVLVRCDSTATVGDIIHNSVHVLPTSVSEIDTTDNRYSWDTRVRGSFDPNEIEVSPKGYGTDGYIPDGTALSYMIHFQNTGTADAETITVADTISNDLDIATLQFIGASHNVIIVQPEPGSRVVKFRFNEIYLPDSGTDRSGSNGWVSYNILPKTDRAPGTQIRNTAAIYFDYNPAVVTNTVLNTIEDTLGPIAGPSSVCVGSNITLTNALAGGAWSSGNALATISGGIVTGVSSGIDTISYTAYGEFVTQKVINVIGAPVAGAITGPSVVCAGGAHITLSSATTGGIWSSSAMSVASINSAGVVTGITSGSTSIAYIITNSCGADTARANITVNPLPSAGTISGVTTVCATATTMLSSSVTGGVWSSVNATIATIGTTGSVTALAAGVDTIKYAFTNSCGTDVSHTVLTVNPLPVAGTISGTTTVCAAASIALTSSITGGIWSSSTPAIATVSAAGLVTGISAGFDTVKYSYTNSCGTDVVSTVISVNPLPVAGAIAGAVSVCMGATTNLTNSVTLGNWSSGNSSIATVDGTGSVKGIAPGNCVISYTVVNGCGTDFTTAPMQVFALPVITISDAHPCGEQDVLTASGIASNVYSWGGPGLSATTGEVVYATITGRSDYTAAGVDNHGCLGHGNLSIEPNRIMGQVTYTGSIPDNLATAVWLLQVNPADSALIWVDSMTTCMYGTVPFFEFDGKASGNYLIKAAPLSGNNPGGNGYIPAYAAATPYWDNARLANHGNGLDHLPVSLNMGTVNAGPGFISGYITKRGSSANADVPASDVTVYLRNAAGNVLTYVYTNQKGYYVFDKLAYDTYDVYPTGFQYYTTPSASITLRDGSEAINNINFRIQHSDRQISPLVTNNYNPRHAGVSNVYIFPNPSNGELNIEWVDKFTEDINLSITDAAGRMVLKNTWPVASTTGKISTDISSLAPGVYLVHFRSGSVSYVGKVVKE